jgi:exonuclease SbcC
VPSERSAAKQLRSHHAADGVAPRVVLEASLSGAGSGSRGHRSGSAPRSVARAHHPAGTRAGRGSRHRADGTCWRSLTNRLDEAGHLVTDLLGMTLGQFSQVVLLPQGQFDTFLRASSDDRHKVLTQLFRTRRFEDVERWLSDRRTTLRRAGERHHDTVAGLLHRVSEATGADLPSDWDVADLSEPADDRRHRDLDRFPRGASRRAGRLHRDGAGRRGPGAGLGDRGPRRRKPPPRAPAAARLGARRSSWTRRHRRAGRHRP